MKPITIAAIVLGSMTGIANAADPAERRALDDQVLHGNRGYVEAPIPYFAAPPVYYRKKVTTRTCIDDGDGITCHYDRFSSQ